MRVRGTQNEVPEIEVNIDTVYIRSNITRIEEDNFTGWEYDEEQINKDEYICSIAKENLLLKTQILASSERSDFLEEVLVEIGLMVYS